MKIKKFLKDNFTGADGQTFDIGRVLWFQATQAFIAISLYAIYKGSYTFDPLTWGAGLATIAGGFGGALYAKAGTEPVPHSMMIKTDRVTFRQSTGRPMGNGGDDDGGSGDNDDSNSGSGDDDSGSGSDSGSDSGRSLPPPPPPPPPPPKG